MNEIEAYAMNMVIEGARFFVENDVDEDEQLSSKEDWQKAVALGQLIVDWIGGNTLHILDCINEGNAR